MRKQNLGGVQSQVSGIRLSVRKMSLAWTDWMIPAAFSIRGAREKKDGWILAGSVRTCNPEIRLMLTFPFPFVLHRSRDEREHRRKERKERERCSGSFRRFGLTDLEVEKVNNRSVRQQEILR